MKVHRCDTLLVTFTDKSCCAPHGLAVETYFPKGIISQPGQSSSMRLQATISGQFALTEHIFSPTYLFDRNSGTLNVTWQTLAPRADWRNISRNAFARHWLWSPARSVPTPLHSSALQSHDFRKGYLVTFLDRGRMSRIVPLHDDSRWTISTSLTLKNCLFFSWRALDLDSDPPHRVRIWVVCPPRLPDSSLEPILWPGSYSCQSDSLICCERHMSGRGIRG